MLLFGMLWLIFLRIYLKRFLVSYRDRKGQESLTKG